MELEKLTRAEYIDLYKKLGSQMFKQCYIPNVGDFAKAFIEKDKTAIEKINTITAFTGNAKDIEESLTRRKANYTEGESAKFMKSVIAANVSDITESGFFYKKTISSCDNMTIDLDADDCGSSGYELALPIDESTFNYKVKNHFIMELNTYIEKYEDLPDLPIIHVRNFTSCKHSDDHRTFCKKCAGIYRREMYTTFIPSYIGVYSTLMVTEKATQSALDSMNKGTAERLNVLLEQHICDLTNYNSVVNAINKIIDQIGNVGVESRFYEIVLLSRMYFDKKWYAAPLVTSFLRQEDEFGAFIYRPNKMSFKKLLSKPNKRTSLKTKIAFDDY